MKFHPYIQRPKQLKTRKIRAISYVLTEKPHKTKEYEREAERMKVEGWRDRQLLGTKFIVFYVIIAPIHFNVNQ